MHLELSGTYTETIIPGRDEVELEHLAYHLHE